jgi:sortase A
MTVIPLFSRFYLREDAVQNGLLHTRVTEMGWISKLEHLLRNAGVLLVALFVVAMVHRIVLSGAELKQFKVRQTVLAAESKQLAQSTATPDFTLWSEQRVRDYQASLAAHFSAAVGILRIAKIKLEVPILEGTDVVNLNRGVGHVAGTANPGEDGNVAIAGHRDGFFRGLKDVSLGDALEVASLQDTETYIVDRITVVDPSDVSVLQARTRSSLTLITCYPFHYIGSSPKRYIVQASVIDPAPVNLPVRNQPGSRAASVGSVGR